MVERNAKLTLQFDTDQAQASLGEMTNASETSRRSLSDMADKAKQAIDKVNSSTSKLGDRVTQAAGALGAISTGINAMIATSGQADSQLGKLAASFGTVATAAGSGAAAFGPWGAVIGGAVAGVTELITWLRREEAAHTAAARAAEQQANSIDHLVDQMERQGQIQLLSRGLASVTEQENALTEALQRQQAAQQRVTNAELERNEVLLRARRRLEPLVAERDRLLAIEDRTISQQSRLRLIQEGLARQQQENLATVREANHVIRAYNIALETETATVVNLQEALETARQAQEDFNQAQEEARRREERRERARQAAEDARRERLAAIAELEQMAEGRFEMVTPEALQRIAEMNIELERTGNIVGPESAAARALREARDALAAFNIELNNRSIDNQIGAMARLTEQTNEAREKYEELQNAVIAAHNGFTGAWTQGIDGFIDRLHELQEAQRAAGESVTTFGQVAGDALLAVGNSVVSNIGEKFSSAFSQALTAVVKGEKSFGKAMEGMLKSLLEAVFAESIIQALKEYALAIGDLASYRYDSAALHFAAGAAWTAVAVATGAGAAAMNAAQPPAASAAPSPGTMAQNDNAQAQPAGNVTIVYNGNVFATRDELTRDFEEMLRQSQNAA